MPRLEGTLARIQQWDEALCMRANRGARRGPLLSLCRAASWLGDGVFWYALMLAILLAHGRDAAIPVLHMLLGGLAATAVYKALKRGTLRPRPCQVHAQIAAGASALDTFSFPSGHMLHAVTFTIIGCAYFPRLALLLVPFSLLTAASRVALGLHYPSDVLAGAAVGGILAAASFLF